MFNKNKFNKDYKNIEEIEEDYNANSEIVEPGIKNINVKNEIGELPFGPVKEKIDPPRKPFQGEPPMNNKSDSPYRPEIPRKVVDIPNTTRLQPDKNDSDASQRLIIGKTITIKGDISSCNILVIEGKVEANVFDVKTIEIAEGGVFKGKAEVENASIAGFFEGTLIARNNLDISHSGKVTGNIKYTNISISPGGTLQGTLDIIGENKKQNK